MCDDENMVFSKDGGYHERNRFVYTGGDIIRAVKNIVCPGMIERRAKHDKAGDLFSDRML